MNREPTRTNAFTLIEVLIVAAVIAALLVLLYPVASEVILRSRAVSCTLNLRRLSTAFMAYRTEHNGYLPPGNLLPVEDRNTGGNGSYLWKDYLFPDHRGELPRCPSMKLSAAGEASSSARAQFKSRTGYAINGYLLGLKLEAVPGPYWGSAPYPGNSRFVFLAESYTGGGAIWSPSQLEFTLAGADFVGMAPRNHRPNTLNYCFLDGHIEPLTTPLKADGASRDWNELFGFGANNKRKDGSSKYIGPYGNVYNPSANSP